MNINMYLFILHLIFIFANYIISNIIYINRSLKSPVRDCEMAYARDSAPQASID